MILPEIATPNGLAERMLEAVLDVAERRNGERPELHDTREAALLAFGVRD